MKHNRAAAPAWPVPRHTFAGTRGNGGGVTLQFREVFERFGKNRLLEFRHLPLAAFEVITEAAGEPETSLEIGSICTMSSGLEGQKTQRSQGCKKSKRVPFRRWNLRFITKGRATLFSLRSPT
jgi:hypothetical protein